VFENGVLRRIFGPRREALAGGWRRLHNKEHHNFNSLPNISRVMKSRRMRWAGYISRMEEIRNAYIFLLENGYEGSRV
jgi:hypothetical protein